MEARDGVTPEAPETFGASEASEGHGVVVCPALAPGDCAAWPAPPPYLRAALIAGSRSAK
jgi:hypothetical protein